MSMSATKVRLDFTKPMPLELFADPILAAIVLSLFCDRRATDEFGRERGGWWGDGLAEQVGDQWGCARWTQQRRLNVPETLRLEEDYDLAALQWMIDDGVAKSIDIEAFDMGNERMGATIIIDGSAYELEVVNAV